MSKTENEVIDIDAISVIESFVREIDRNDLMHGLIAEVMADFIMRVFSHAEKEHEKTGLTYSTLLKIASRQLSSMSNKCDRNAKILIDKSRKEERDFQNRILS